MFKSLFTLALLAVASGHELDRAAGTWEALKIFSTAATPDATGDKVVQNFTHLKLAIAPLDGSFKCEGDGKEMTFPAVNLILTTQKAGESSPSVGYKPNFPMKIVQSGDETEDLIRQSLMCPHLGDQYRGSVIVLRFINDDYLVLFYMHGYVSLMSKLQPDEDTVKTIIESDPVLKTAREVQSLIPIRS